MADFAELELRIKSLEAVQATKALRDLEEAARRAERAASIDIRVSSVELQQAQLRLSVMQKELRATEQAMRDKQRQADNLTRSIQRLNNQLQFVTRSLSGFFSAFLAYRAIDSAVTSLAKFELGMVRVGKTTDTTGDDLKRLSAQFLGLSTRLAVPLEDLVMYGKVAGQVGIRGSQNILKFAETIGRLSAVTEDFKGDEAARSLGRLVFITGAPISDIDRLGSVIVKLGNNLSTTEGQIVHAAKFIAQSTTAFKLSAPDVLALAGAVAATGQTAESSATAFARSFQEMNRAALTGGNALARFADIAGVTSEEFKALFDKSQAQAFMAFIKGVGEAGKSGAVLADVFGDVGIEAQRSNRVLQTLASRFELTAKSAHLVNSEMQANAELADESNKVFATLSGAMQRLSNTYQAALNSTEGLASAARLLVDALQLALLGLVATPVAVDKVSTSTRVLTAVLITLAVTLGAMAVGKFLVFLRNVVTAIKATTLAVSTLNGVMALNPMVAAITIIGAIAGALIGMRAALNGATAETQRFNTALEDIKRVRDGITGARGSFDLAKQMGDIPAQAQALRNMRAELVSLATAMKTRGTPFGEGEPGELSKTLQRGGVTGPASSRMTNSAMKLSRGQRDQLQVQGRLEEFIPPTAEAVVVDLIKRIEELDGEIKALESVASDAGGTLSNAFTEGEEAAQKFLDTLRLQREVLAASADGDELAGALVEARQKLDEAFKGDKADPASRLKFVQAIEKEITATFNLREQVNALRDARREEREEMDKKFERTKDFVAFKRGIEDEIRLMRKSADMRDVERQMIEFQTLAKAADITLTEKQLQLMRNRLSLLQLLSRGEKKTEQSSVIEDLELELELLGKTANQRAVTLAMREREKQLKVAGATEEQAKAQAEMDQARIESLITQIELAQELRGAGEDFGRALGDSLENAIFEGGKLRDIIKGFLSDIARAAFQRFVTNQLMNIAGAAFGGMAGGTTNRRGNAFGGGRVIPMARGGTLDRGVSASLAAGGIISGPTLVPQALIGEGSRAEAVMPLNRTSRGELAIMASIGGRSADLPIGRLGDGNLGVQMSADRLGTGGGSIGSGAGVAGPQGFSTGGAIRARAISIHQTIVTPNPDAFRSSQSQLMANTKRAARLI